MGACTEPRRSVRDSSRDAERALGECLTALIADANGAAPHEVIVVDDGSKDATATVAQALGARVIRLPGLGPAAARNAGARAATGDVLVFFDADCVPQLGCVEALVAPLRDPGVVGVRRVDVVGEPGVVGLRDPGHPGHPRARLHHVTNVQEDGATPPALSSACASTRRSS